MKKWLGLILVAGLAVSAAACTPVEKAPEAAMQVKPVDLFAGDAQKFKPFLGLMSGAVQVKYRGKSNEIKTTLEVWEYGKKTQTLGELGESIRDKDGKEGKEEQYSFDGEAIFSVKGSQGEDPNKTHYEITVALTDKNGSTSSQLDWVVDAKQVASSPIELAEELNLQEGERAAVWGMQATDEQVIKTVDFTPESLKNAKWALLVFMSAGSEETPAP
ncbi:MULTISPECIES: hypothetical protein [Brevibacillus]|uniref:hypothetical protein n=1 Tax=Brevibacillus TaxID=55080 RepID=UPI0004F3E0AE|nr:hypothetical protein [Brevibacillus borstelensis]KKX56465.1 hypothetical protein X546_03410 [Brevibacillus borstelensis cifa_chp40]MCM3468817.1 hypothetical protein [Brevibacillus borstelensis]MCM3621491.1 hypothetical protein [Brevibacillus borstelensis]MED1742706.1 hypothetical protein [Brevibacillus borstelensis]MED1852771.1 hypothetical protein [Brevibacillus borstelensis]